MSDIAQEEKIEAGVHNYSAEEDYVTPTEPEVLKQLEWFKDQKLGLMMHWGIYSQIGLVESWGLSDEDADWSREDVDWTDDPEAFKQQYFDLNKSFNPIRFEPEKWAKLAKESGFRYLTATTKHHDGFCMWDSRYSDYKVTAPDCPFHTNPRADILRHLWDAFRAEGLAISAYFSKADWHTPYYWAPGGERAKPTWRGPSYDPEKEPALWEKFVEFTHNQVKELCTNYGRVDMLWFDAGWVCPQSKVRQDIRLGELVDEVRKTQPWILSADRTVGGPYENVVTPEQCVPERPLNIPWESCITMGTGFSFRYEDDYKSPREIICLLTDIVAKGGNLALNVAPQPDGRLPKGAIRSMKGMGEWLSRYGEAIYGTRPCAPYKTGNLAFTQKGDSVYAIRLYPDKNEPADRELLIPCGKEVVSARMVGCTKDLAWTRDQDGIRVTVPECGAKETPIAHVFELKVK